MMTMTTMKASRLLELPWELFLHVLTRLPLKYLMKLRCVSKFFLNLINNPNFITSYRLHCNSNPPNPNLRLDDDFNFMDTITLYSSLLLLLSPSSSPAGSKYNQLPWRFHISFKGSNFIYLQKQHKLIPFRCPSHKLLIGSMNGLVCLGGPYSLEIYNILAGTHYYFLTCSSPPDRIFYNLPSTSIPSPIFAFGYDPISKDYKIPAFDNTTIYSFKTKSWTELDLTGLDDDFWDYESFLRNRSICVNGIIYWPPAKAKHARPYYNGGILSYNLHRKIFKEIESPKEDIQLLSFRGCLAFACIKRTTKTKSSKGRRRGEEGGGGGGGGEGEKARDIKVNLFILKSSNGGGGGGGENYSWIKERFVIPISPPKEAEIVSCFDEIFLGWFESKRLRLYNLHTKCFFNLPLSQSSSDYYPKVSIGKKKDVPTYVNKLSFDFSLI